MRTNTPPRESGFAAILPTFRPLRKLPGRCLALLLAALLLFGAVPLAAAESDQVLATLYHKDARNGEISGQAVTFTVAYSFGGDIIDFSSGLTPTYNSNFKNVVLTVDDKIAAVGDESNPAVITLSYHLSTDDSSAPKRQVTYTLYVRRADPIPATFYGTANFEILAGTEKAIPAEKILDLYKQNDGEPLSHIVITGYTPTFGNLLLDGVDFPFGRPISIGDIQAGKLTFAARDTGTVNYNVTAFAGGDTTNPVGVGATLTISAYTKPETRGTVQVEVTKGRLFTFTLEDFEKQSELFNMRIEEVTITPQKTSAGTWLFKGSAMRTGTATKIPASEVGYLEFNATASGTANFTWRVKTGGGETANAAGVITVHAIAVELENYVSPTPLGKGGVYAISASHFKYKISSDVADTGPLAPTYLKISQVPPTKDGYLYLAEALPKAEDGSYPAISAETALKAGAIIPFSFAGQLRIASNSASSSESITFSWTLTADKTVKNADWAAPALYTVPFSEGKDITYSTDVNVPITLHAGDFLSALSTATGASLSYVTFTLPNKDQGALYYDYNLLTSKGTAVTTSTKLYYGRTPSLASVWFVPAKDYYGACTFTYTAFSEGGVRVSGNVTVYINRTSGGTVVLKADKNAPLDLDAEAFRAAFKTATGKELDSIQFTTTATSARLYTGYIAPGQYGSIVTTGTRLYLHAAPLLSRTTFVPSSEFTGSVTYTYLAYTAKNEAYYGKLVVFVVESLGGNVCYSVNTNGYVRLDAADFKSAFTAASGSLLSAVTFTLPAKTAGTLYESYNPVTKKGTAVKAATKYFVSDSPSISDITFVPADNLTGTVDVTFTAISQSGVSYTGKLKFLVGRGESFGDTYIRLSLHARAGAPAAMNPDAFRAAFLRETGKPLFSVRFTPPSAYEGRLCTGYVSPSSPGTLVSDTTRYYLTGSPALSGVVFVPAADFGSGTVLIAFDAYSADGTAYAGHLTVYVGAASPFSDTKDYPWAADPIAFLYDMGVVHGTGAGRFNPGQPITRADFVVMVARAFQLSGGSETFSDVPYGSYYYSAVAAAKSLGIVQGYQGKFLPNTSLTRQDAMVILKRTADTLGITLPAGRSSLSQFQDAWQVADYARGAVEALVAAGVITGSDGRVNPKSPISRAEMAAALYRVLLLKSK